ncbi:MAG TPA: N-6 DNA methylase, partial [Myxococcota bacterium]|nr:N-6 DNA methylase [Myxococcota bacterium]
MPASLRPHLHAALCGLGQALLQQPENRKLRADLASERLSVQDYYAQLLCLVYRLLFLLILEDRGILHADDTPAEARRRYAEAHSLRRLWPQPPAPPGLPASSGYWRDALATLRGLGTGLPALGLPRLGGLFGLEHCRDLDATTLDDRAFLQALSSLGCSAEAPLPWRGLSPEELGGAYESLMERAPLLQSSPDGLAFTLPEDSRSNARKKSGSYYTPDRLVQHLVDLALDPLIAETLAAAPADPAEALLSLRIVDPACGTGHFLLGAARRLAVAVARARGEPGAVQAAFVEVIRRCIYGVDLNPMAVELCRVALWLEAAVPGLPLDVSGAHLQLGNALLGASAAQIAAGIPENAWEAAEGEDRSIARMLRARHRAEAGAAWTGTADLRLLADLW